MDQSFYEAKKQAVIEEITAAFDGVALEDGVSFHEAIVRDDERIEDRNHEIRVAARAKDSEARWQEIPDEQLTRQGHSILNFLDPKGFRYLLPAFLVWYMRHADNEGVDSNTFESIDYQLEGGVAEKVGDSYLARFSILSPQQCRAVAHFLEFEIVRIEKINTDDEAEIESQVAQGIISKDEGQELRERWRCKDDYIQRALTRYWGQFLDENSQR